MMDWQKGLLALVLCCLVAPVLADDDDDPRAYMHGICAVSDGKGGDWVFFSSSGLPPAGENDDEDWTHDVYVGRWQDGLSRLSPKPFIRKPEAQEPVSAAQSEDGHVMVLTEDGWDSENEVDLRYAIYDRDLKPVLTYPQTAADGGHSGHVAAAGNRFIAFYSDNWIEGGGVDDLGTGHGVIAKIYSSKGEELRTVPVAPHQRDWWPVLAASPDKAMLVWQSYVKGQTYARLKIAVLDPATGHLSATRVLRDDVQYYTYAVQYVAAARLFLVMGATRTGEGFAFMVNEAGGIVASANCLPAIIREAGVSIVGRDAFVPVAGNQLARLHLGDHSIEVAGLADSPIRWNTVGSLGLVRADGGLHWFSLDKSGLQEADFGVKSFHDAASFQACR